MKAVFFFLIISQSVLDVGKSYLNQNDYEKAYQIFQQIYTVSKNTPEGNWARYYLSISLIGLGDTLSAIGNLLTLRKENLDDSLAFLIYSKLLELSTSEKDSATWFYELITLHPSINKRDKLIYKVLNFPLEDSLKITFLQILASDYKNKNNLKVFSESLLNYEAGYSLLIAKRENFPLIKAKAQLRENKYLDAYYSILKENPTKTIPEEATEFLNKSNNSPLIIGLLLALNPENEKTAFEMARILEESGIGSTKFKKILKNPVYVAYFNLKNLTLEDLQKLEELPPSNLKQYVLARGYLFKGYGLKALNYAIQLPDSIEYNAFKLELADSFITWGFYPKEVTLMLENIQNYYPLTERDKRLIIFYKTQGKNVSSLRKKLAVNETTITHKIRLKTEDFELTDSLLIERMFENFDYEGVIKYSGGKALPNRMKFFIASSLIERKKYEEALVLIENERFKFPDLFVISLAHMDDPSPYLYYLPLPIKPENAYYVYIIAKKTGNYEILENYPQAQFKFYRSILKEDIEQAELYLDSTDPKMLKEFIALLYAKGNFEKVIQYSSNLNPLYPIEKEIFAFKLKSLFESGRYEDVIKEGKKFSSLIFDEDISLIMAKAYYQLKEYDRSFLYSTHFDSTTFKEIMAVNLLQKGYIEIIDPSNLKGPELLTYYFLTKKAQALLQFEPQTKEEAILKMKFLTMLKKEIPDTLLINYTSRFDIEQDFPYILKALNYLNNDNIDSLEALIGDVNIQDPEILYEFGLKLISLGKIDDAIKILKQSLDFSADSLKHEILFRLGNIEATSGNFYSSIFYYTKALEYSKKYEKEILYNLSVAYKNTGQRDSAIALLEKIIQEFKDDDIVIDASINLGFQLLEYQQTPEKAINILSKIIGLGSKEQDCEALYWLSRAYLLRQDLKNALTTLKRIYTHYSEFSDWRDMAKLDAAKILVYYNYRDDAKRLYQEVIKSRKPGDPISEEAKSQMEFFKL